MPRKYTDEDILIMEKVSPKVAAYYLGCSPDNIYLGLQNGVFPFGVAIRHDIEWSYDIRPRALVEYNRHGKKDLLKDTVNYITACILHEIKQNQPEECARSTSPISDTK